MKNRIEWDLILNYLDGNCSVSDEKRITEWAANDEKNKAELDLLKSIWSSQPLQLPKPDVEKALQNVRQRIESLSHKQKTPFTPPFGFWGKMSKRNLWDFVLFPRTLKIAATLIVCIIGTIVILNIFSESSYKEIAVGKKIIKEVMLPDGTKVTLDSGSILKYSEDFGNNDREVFLNGEGYFEVTQDKNKKFIVKTHSAKIMVLGTKFNLRAWEQYNKETVAVVEGKVQFGSNGSEVIIRKGQMSYVVDGSVSPPSEFNVNTQLSWMKREMKFQSTTLGEVLGQLSRWYDVEFTLPDDSYKTKIITVYLENKPLEDILDVISLIMKFKYERKGNKVKFELEN